MTNMLLSATFPPLPDLLCVYVKSTARIFCKVVHISCTQTDSDVLMINAGQDNDSVVN
jgi:hypothetical protein